MEKKISRIKLYNTGVLDCGTMRLQSQLYVGKASADFILQDGVLKNWGNGVNGFDFYEVNIPYEIVNDIKEISYQPL